MGKNKNKRKNSSGENAKLLCFFVMMFIFSKKKTKVHSKTDGVCSEGNSKVYVRIFLMMLFVYALRSFSKRKTGGRCAGGSVCPLVSLHTNFACAPIEKLVDCNTMTYMTINSFKSLGPVYHWVSYSYTFHRDMFLNTTDPLDLCAVRCDESITVQDDARDFFRDTVKSAVMSHDFSIIGNLFDKEKLRPLCNVTARFVACTNNCTDRPWKQKMLAIYEPLIFICHGSHFMKHVDCLHNVYTENKNSCEERERCQGYRQNAVGDIGLLTSALGGESALQTNLTIKSLTNHMCNFIECTNECRSPEIVIKCGKQANRQLLLFYRRLVDSMKLVLLLYHRALTQQKEGLVYDDHCDRLGVAHF